MWPHKKLLKLIRGTTEEEEAVPPMGEQEVEPVAGPSTAGQEQSEEEAVPSGQQEVEPVAGPSTAGQEQSVSAAETAPAAQREVMDAEVTSDIAEMDMDVIFETAPSVDSTPSLDEQSDSSWTTCSSVPTIEITERSSSNEPVLVDIPLDEVVQHKIDMSELHQGAGTSRGQPLRAVQGYTDLTAIESNSSSQESLQGEAAARGLPLRAARGFTDLTVIESFPASQEEQATCSAQLTQAERRQSRHRQSRRRRHQPETEEREHGEGESATPRKRMKKRSSRVTSTPDPKRKHKKQ